MFGEKSQSHGRIKSANRGASFGWILPVVIGGAVAGGYLLGIHHANMAPVSTVATLEYSTRAESDLVHPRSGAIALDSAKSPTSRDALLDEVVGDELSGRSNAYASDPFSVLRRIAKAVPRAFEQGIVSRSIARNSPFDEADLVGIENPIAFAVRMAEVSMTPLGDGVSPPPEEKRSMRFVDAEQLEQDPANEHSGYFFEDVGRVFGLYSLPGNYDRPDVLLSWRNTTNGDRMRFRKMPVTSARTQLLSFQPREQWSSGTYQVAVFSTHESLDVISFGNYDIHEN